MDERIETARGELKKRFETLDVKRDILKAPELRQLYLNMKDLPPEDRPAYGQAINELKAEVERMIAEAEAADADAFIAPIDITAPYDVNVPSGKRPKLLASEYGSKHPLMTELEAVLDIFYRMGFTAVESRQIDDDYHMFTSLNFPEGHPARDEYDTFMTVETDKNGHQLIAPAHTSIMQVRILHEHKAELESGKPIAAVIPGRVFRNEDLDARHEHTFYQFEGVYVGKGVNAGNLLATFKTFLGNYYEQAMRSKRSHSTFLLPSRVLSWR